MSKTIDDLETLTPLAAFVLGYLDGTTANQPNTTISPAQLAAHFGVDRAQLQDALLELDGRNLPCLML